MFNAILLFILAGFAEIGGIPKRRRIFFDLISHHQISN